MEINAKGPLKPCLQSSMHHTRFFLCQKIIGTGGVDKITAKITVIPVIGNNLHGFYGINLTMHNRTIGLAN